MPSRPIGEVTSYPRLAGRESMAPPTSPRLRIPAFHQTAPSAVSPAGSKLVEGRSSEEWRARPVRNRFPLVRALV